MASSVPADYSGSVGIENVSVSAIVAPGKLLIDENVDRVGLYVFNDSPQPLYLKYGLSGSTEDFTHMVYAYTLHVVEEPVYTGSMWGVWALSTGSAHLTRSEERV